MSTFTQIYYHIIFSTYSRQTVLDEENHEKLFRYIWGILKKRSCKLYRINARPDHVHVFLSLHPSISLANLIKEIKTASTKWIKAEAVFRYFEAWQKGYGAFTYSHLERKR